MQGSQFWNETYCLFVAREEFEHVLQLLLVAGYVSHNSAGVTSTTVMFAWGAQLRSSLCAYTSALLWMIYSLYSLAA